MKATIVMVVVWMLATLKIVAAVEILITMMMLTIVVNYNEGENVDECNEDSRGC